MLAINGGRPEQLNLKDFIATFTAFREEVVSRRTKFLLRKARDRAHVLVGLAIAVANIDEVIRVIRSSKTQPEAKERLMEIKTPGALLKRALGDEGYAQFQEERGVAEDYSLTPVQADAILRMTLGQLVNLEQEKLADEHAALLAEIADLAGILADQARIFAIIREDCEMLIKRGDVRQGGRLAVEMLPLPLVTCPLCGHRVNPSLN